MKPYRLINVLELQQLTQQFKQELDAWNAQYSSIPLDLHLAIPPKHYRVEHATMLQKHDKELACIEGEYLSVLTQALFGCDKSCFYTVSQELTLELFSKLFQIEACTLQPHQRENPDWFYAGSTSLFITLNCEHNNFTLIVNPDWIYQQLPLPQPQTTPLISIDEAVAKQTVSLSLELISSHLSVKNLANMQVGDVLTTKHPITEPLRVIRGKELCAQAELGQSSSHKSIILKRTS